MKLLPRRHQGWVGFVLGWALSLLLSLGLSSLQAAAFDRGYANPIGEDTALACPDPDGLFACGTSLAVTGGFADLLQQGYQQFEKGQLEAALQQLDQALQAASGPVDEAIVLSNLALVQGQLGNWDTANRLITDSLSRLEATAQPLILAQVLNLQGRLLLAQGDAQSAYEVWRQAEAAYRQAGHSTGVVRSRIRQARALQALGFYRKSVDEILEPLRQELARQPDSLEKVVGLRTLGESLQVANSLESAQTALNESLKAATPLDLAVEAAATRLALGNLAYAQARRFYSIRNPRETQASAQVALNAYRAVANDAAAGDNRMRAQINQFSLLLDLDQWATAEEAVPWLAQATALWPQIQAQVAQLPPTRDGTYARINLAHSASRLHQRQPSGSPDWPEILNLLETASLQAEAQGDVRAQAYALGHLGRVYRDMAQAGSPSLRLQAIQATEAALLLAESINAADMTYQWYEQLGDLQVITQHKAEAIAAYRGAVKTLKTLRSDLLNINPEVQFSFQDSIEPIHRKLVSLLLEGVSVDQPGASAPIADAQRTLILKDAREVIESLQLEELNNFLRAACLNTREVSVDQVAGAEDAVVLYPILIPGDLKAAMGQPGDQDDLKIIVTRPQPLADQPEQLYFYTSQFPAGDLDRYRDQMLLYTVRQDDDVIRPAEQLYHFLFPPPLVANLEANPPKTLVLVPDSPMRNIPLSALYDGQHFLIEKYAIAVTPGLHLLNPYPLQNQPLKTLAFGLTQERQGLPPLPNVETEIAAINAQLPSEEYLDDDFTFEAIQSSLETTQAPIVHLATHGQFSSQLENTFLLAWDQKISIDNLGEWLQNNPQRSHPIEMLVLSACETAVGDHRAALGLAGMAVRAGARSTIASLWQVDDRATSLLMEKFYQNLADAHLNRSEALRSAQLFVLETFPEEFDHPYFWAPFVLVGNWA